MNEMIIEELLSYMNSTKDFVLNEYPEVVSQIFLYEKFSNLSAAIFSGSFFLICVFVAIYFCRNPTLDKYDHWTLPCIYYVMGSCGGGLLALITFANSTDKLIKLYIAPKYYLIDLILGMKR